MDRAVVPALCQPGVLEVHGGPRAGGKKQAGLRPVTKLTWLGAETHGELWNWVRVEPADASGPFPRSNTKASFAERATRRAFEVGNLRYEESGHCLIQRGATQRNSC